MIQHILGNVIVEINFDLHCSSIKSTPLLNPFLAFLYGISDDKLSRSNDGNHLMIGEKKFLKLLLHIFIEID